MTRTLRFTATSATFAPGTCPMPALGDRRRARFGDMPHARSRRQAPRSLWGHAPRSLSATGATLAPGTCPTLALRDRRHARLWTGPALALGDRRHVCSGDRPHHVTSAQAAACTPVTRSLLARGEQHSFCAPLLAREQNKQQRNDRPTPKNLRQAVSGVRNRALHLHLKEPLLRRLVP